jgi:hypothetical protein
MAVTLTSKSITSIFQAHWEAGSGSYIPTQYMVVSYGVSATGREHYYLQNGSNRAIANPVRF